MAEHNINRNGGGSSETESNEEESDDEEQLSDAEKRRELRKSRVGRAILGMVDARRSE